MEEDNSVMLRRKKIYDLLKDRSLSVGTIRNELNEPRGSIHADCQVMVRAGVLKESLYKYSHGENDFSVYSQGLNKKNPMVFRCKLVAALFGETGMARA